MHNKQYIEERVKSLCKYFDWEEDSEQANTIHTALHQALAERDREIAKDVIGEIGAKLLAKHSPQNVLDAYFDVANEELEKYESDN